MDTKHSRFLALAELLLDEIHATTEVPATAEDVAELLSRMILTIDAFRVAGGDVPSFLEKTVRFMDAYQEVGQAVLASPVTPSSPGWSKPAGDTGDHPPFPMPEPDPRRIRLEELRHQLETLARQVLTSPVDSLERGTLSEQFRELMDHVLVLRRELEADP
ncbi:hypothetical protein KBY82_07345 [Cyanobium sp. AMD-g]|uniref:hypothetical protein n=1 Tax=Cyanobium sp. AMD-g TaxID=2823699 RepID=UPI0020CB85CB|nr:hypothetical protein [Cyanobium sp. AMD-g]MCP9930593.1 hypothetical protein [Cyanobium sp. AMD-g]